MKLLQSVRRRRFSAQRSDRSIFVDRQSLLGQHKEVGDGLETRW
ncbi:MAG: hypothetical protein ACKN81_13360 [Pirellulaceae bacterium]